MGHVPAVRIVKVGTICLEPSEPASAFTQTIKSELGIGGGSTVTLLQADRRILVDTGFDREWLDTAGNNQTNAADITRDLKTQRMTPDDVDAVFITHWHRDHFGNLDVFRKAERVASKNLAARFGLDDFRGVSDGDEIAEGVRALFTPGHTIDHVSLVVDCVLGDVRARVAIAGDAVVSHSYFQSGRIWRYNADFYDGRAANESVLRLVGHADIIIPGHGAPFMTYRPEWLEP